MANILPAIQPLHQLHDEKESIAKDSAEIKLQQNANPTLMEENVQQLQPTAPAVEIPIAMQKPNVAPGNIVKKKIYKTTDKRHEFKPFSFNWAFEAFKMQEKLHWNPEEVSMKDDVREFYSVLSEVERSVITQILRFFTQTDAEVARCYLEYYIPIFKGCPEITMMLVKFAAMEATHQWAYSYLPTSLALKDEIYSEFLNYKEMVDKYDYMQNFSVANPQSVALTLAIVSGGIEGFVLYSSFAILISFSAVRSTSGQKNVLSGLGSIVSFSVRDESLHSVSIIRLFHTYVSENLGVINIVKLKEDINEAFRTLIRYEFNFIDLVYSKGGLQFLSSEDLKDYIKHLVNKRMQQLGLDPMFPEIKKSKLPWMERFLLLPELAQFLETSVTSYSKLSDQNNIFSAYDDLYIK